MSVRGNRITQWVKQIAQKIPVITKLEKKLGMLQGLDPVLESIVMDLDRVTDFSKLIRLQTLHKEELKIDDMQEFDKYGDPIREHPAKRTVADIMNEMDDAEDEIAADPLMDASADDDVETAVAKASAQRTEIRAKAKEAKAQAKLEAAEEEAEAKIEEAEEEAQAKIAKAKAMAKKAKIEAAAA